MLDILFSGLIGIIGVILGFFLNVVYGNYRESKFRERSKRSIMEELKANSHLILQKKDIVRKIIDNLVKGNILPGKSVGFMTSIYDYHIKDIYPYLKEMERNSLHLIYQRLKIEDNNMQEFEENIMGFAKTVNFQNMNEVYNIFSVRMKELYHELELTKKLISDHLSGKPRDVLYIETGDNRPTEFT